MMAMKVYRASSTCAVRVFASSTHGWAPRWEAACGWRAETSCAPAQQPPSAERSLLVCGSLQEAQVCIASSLENVRPVGLIVGEATADESLGL